MLFANWGVQIAGMIFQTRSRFRQFSFYYKDAANGPLPHRQSSHLKEYRLYQEDSLLFRQIRILPGSLDIIRPQTQNLQILYSLSFLTAFRLHSNHLGLDTRHTERILLI